MKIIKKHNKHSIRDIEIKRINPDLKKGVKGSSSDSANDSDKKPKDTQVKRKTGRLRPRRKASSGSKLTFVAALLLFLSSAFVLYVFLRPTKAIVMVIPTIKEVTLADDFIHVAYKEAQAGQLSYSLASTTISSSVTVDADKTLPVKEKASGVIAVYNNYSGKPQRIIRNTRFEAPNGNIYRSKKPFTIPGKSASGPGVASIKVYAEEPGVKYNLPANTKFKLPALTGKAAVGIYAVAKEPISGGFAGERATISEEKKQDELSKLKEMIKKQAIKKSLAALGEDSVSFEDALFVTYSDPKYDYSKKGKLTINLSASAILPVFNKYDFARELLSPSDAELDFTGENKIYIDNIEDLDLKLLSKDSVNLQEDSLIKFTASGTAKARYFIDQDRIKQDLLGKTDAVAKYLKSAYPGIADIKSSITPPWKDSFPNSLDNIKIEIVK